MNKYPLYSIKNLSSTLHSHGKTIKKSLGQNYLINVSMIDKITRSLLNKIEEKEAPHKVLEIGCGVGHLTYGLLSRGLEVLGIEIENKSILILREVLSFYLEDHQLTLIEGDFMKVEPQEILDSSEKIFLIGNLPYYLTSPILFQSFEKYIPYCHGFLFMMQKEVALRIVSKSGSSNYGRISVMSQAYCKNIKIVFHLPKGNFYPSPKIESSMVYFELHEKYPPHRQRLHEIVKASFHMRRKKLSNSLLNNPYNHLDLSILKKTLETHKSLCDKRAQELSVNDFLQLLETYEFFLEASNK